MWKTIDLLGHRTRTEYDALNRVARTIVNYENGVYDAAAPDEDLITAYTYDPLGQQQTITDPLGRVTAYSYDELGRVTGVTNPLGEATTYAYDPAGNRLSVTEAEGRTTGYAYDALNRVVTTTVPAKATYVSGGTRLSDTVSWSIPTLADGESVSVSFVVTATETITNSDYRVTTAGGVSVQGQQAVTTRVYLPPVAAFTASPLSGTAPLTVTFVNSSTNATGYLWDFGDGSTGTVISPTHTYTQAGVYTVSLTAGNGLLTETLTRTHYLTVTEPLVANFAAAPLAGVIPLTVTFVNSSTNATDYEWDFGNGLTGTVISPTHVYTQAGVYTISLTAGNGEVTDTLTRPGYITAYEPPVADFETNIITGTAPLTVTFTNHSTGSVTSCIWNFGDGLLPFTDDSSSFTITHVYTQAGVYTVTLTVNGPGGADVLTHPAYIQVLGADFAVEPETGAAPLQITFTDLLTDHVTGRLWDFGDGQTQQTASDPITTTHTYTQPGIYTPTLTIIRGGYAYTATQPGQIEVVGAEFSVSPQTGLAPLVVTLTDMISLPVSYRAWDFGDGSTPIISQSVTETVGLAYITHTYTQTGIYTPTLTVVRDNYTYTHTLPGTVVVAQNACAITTTAVTWWDSRYLTRQPLTLTVNSPLAYSPGITRVAAVSLDTQSLITNNLLLSDGADLRVVYRAENGWRDLPRHIEDLNSVNTTVYFPLQATITATDTHYYLYYSNATPGAPPELYAAPTTGPTVTTSGSGAITPTVSFTASAYSGLAPLTVDFSAVVTPTEVIANYSWDFGDGGSSSDASPGHTYTAPGLYPVVLTVQTTDGLQVTTTWPAAIAVAGIDVSSDVTVDLGAIAETPVVTALICADSPVPQTFTSADGRLSVIFPPGAVSQDTLVTHTPYRAQVDQGPDSLSRFDLQAATLTGTPVTTFAVPLRLSLDYNDYSLQAGEAGTILFFYWDEASGNWQPIATQVDTAAGQAAAATDHFTNFSVNKNFGLGGPPPLRRLPAVANAGVDLLTGAATYAYPLEAPPGINGMQPNLSLVYHSGAADTRIDEQAGLVGHGFELAGLGWIQRDPDDQDAFYLNLNGVSEKLVKESETTYHTEHETYWKIEYLKQENNEDGYWLVTTQDGTQYWFGLNDLGTGRYIKSAGGDPIIQAYIYYLDQVQDVYGNTMSITYDGIRGEELLDSGSGSVPLNFEYDVARWPVEISYTRNKADNSGLSATRKVKFSYTKTDKTIDKSVIGQVRADFVDQKDTGPGQFFNYPNAINEIQMLVDTNKDQNFKTVRAYQLAYTYYTQDQHPEDGKGDTPTDFGPANYHLMLHNITEHGSDDAALPATTFKYRPTGHLVQVDNGYGGKVGYEYKKGTYASVGAYGVVNVEEETSKWLVSKKTITDTYTNQISPYEYIYKPALYSKGSFLGHPAVTVKNPDGSSNCSEFSLGIHRIEGICNGLINPSILNDPNGEPTWGKPLYVVTLDESGTPLRTVSTKYKVKSVIDGVTFVAPEKVTTVIGDSPAVETGYTYDDKGNIETTVENAGSETQRITTLTYESAVPNVTNRPDTITIKNASGTEVAQTTYDYDYYDVDNSPLKNVTITQHTLNDPATTDVNEGTSPDLVTYTHFDLYGNVDETWTGDDTRKVSIEYDPVYHTFPATVTYPDDSEETFRYDARFGLPNVITDVNGLATGYMYNQFGRVKTVAGANGQIAYNYSDENGQPATGLIVTKTYAGADNTLDTLDDNFDITESYDGLGQLHQRVEPGGNTDAGNTLFRTTDYGYDGLGRQITTTITPAPDGGTPRTLTTQYDALGRPTHVQTLDGTTGYKYTTVKITNDGQEKTCAVVEITDAAGHVKNHALDAFGQVIRLTEDGTTTTYEYNTLGHLRRITDTGGNITQMWYDSLGRKAQMSDPDMGAWKYTYNPYGELATQTDARKVTTTFNYDNLGRLLTKTYNTSDAFDVTETPTVTYVYNKLQTTMSDGSGETVWNYDPAGRLLTETKTITGYTEPFTTGYSYTPLGQLRTMTYPDGETVTYEYNQAGLVTQAKGNADYLTGAAYNPLGQIKNLPMDSGAIQQAFTYHPTSFRPATVTADGLQNLSFGFDTLGRLSAFTDTLHTINLKYDDYGLNGLKHVSGSYEQTYNYDIIGNLTQRDNFGFDYAALNSLPHAPGKITSTDGPAIDLTYDDNGNLITKTSTTGEVMSYTYDAENRLTRIISQTGVTVLTSTFLYNGQGQQVEQMTEKENGETEQVFYAGDHYQVTQKNRLVDLVWNFDSSQQYWNISSYNIGVANGDWNSGGGNLVARFTRPSLSGHNRTGSVQFSRMIPLHYENNHYLSPASKFSYQYRVNRVDNVDTASIDVNSWINTNLTYQRYLDGDNIISTTGWITVSHVLSQSTGEKIAWLNIQPSLNQETWDNIETYIDNVILSSVIEALPPSITKRYYADGRQLALRTDGQLYYTLYDPSGTSLTMVDDNGNEAARILYDAYGGVLTSTFTASALSTALAGQSAVADPATGLVHLGNGRWYDPALGRPLQPNPAGGAPTAPQSLNRYAAASLGQPGVTQAAGSDGNIPNCHAQQKRPRCRRPLCETDSGLTLPVRRATANKTQPGRQPRQQRPFRRRFALGGLAPHRRGQYLVCSPQPGPVDHRPDDPLGRLFADGLQQVPYPRRAGGHYQHLWEGPGCPFAFGLPHRLPR